MIKLSQRLQAIADFVPKGARMADIGTDHGFLPCWLAQQQQVEEAVACDVNAQPLALAQKNVEDYQLGNRVTTRIGDGLTILQPGEVSVVTIAGMGGGLMVEILNTAPSVVAHLQRIILQPNVGAETVRIWAEKNRWQIVQEALLQENERFYVIIVLEPGRCLEPMSAAELYLGPILLAEQHPLLGSYVNEEWQKAQYVLEQLAQSDSEESRKKAYLLRRKWDDMNGVMKCRCGVNLF